MAALSDFIGDVYDVVSCDEYVIRVYVILTISLHY